MLCLQCSNIFFIKDPVGTCDEDSISFGFAANKAGEHTLKISFLGSILTLKKSFLIGEVISFPTNGLNESFEFLGKIFDPEGAEMVFTSNELDYNCFAFETTFKIEL